MHTRLSARRQAPIDHVAAMVTVLRGYATTDAERAIVDKDAERRRRTGVDRDTMVRTIAGEIYNGLRYGTWPWSS